MDSCTYEKMMVVCGNEGGVQCLRSCWGVGVVVGLESSKFKLGEGGRGKSKVKTKVEL